MLAHEYYHNEITLGCRWSVQEFYVARNVYQIKVNVVNMLKENIMRFIMIEKCDNISVTVLFRFDDTKVQYYSDQLTQLKKKSANHCQAKMFIQ